MKLQSELFSIFTVQSMRIDSQLGPAYSELDSSGRLAIHAAEITFLADLLNRHVGHFPIVDFSGKLRERGNIQGTLATPLCGLCCLSAPQCSS